MDIDNLIQRLRQKRVTFSLHDSVGNDYIWMDMWFWHSEDVKTREEAHLPTRTQVSAKDLKTLFQKAMDKLGID